MAIKIFMSKRKARKEHQCKTCRCVIKPGQEYYESKVNRFGYVTWRECKECWQRNELEV